jgi:hypothetical protein
MSKRFFVTTVLMALLTTAMPARAQSGGCSQGDALALATAGFQGASLNLGKGSTAGLGGAWADCQFRLFDDNEDPPDSPEVPHVFSDQDYILGGIYIFEDYSFLDRPEYDRAAAIDYVNSVSSTFFWGSASTPDEDLAELVLDRSAFRDTVFAGSAHLVGQQRYHIFEPGDLAPGEYRWRLEYDDPIFGSFVAHGSVIILES